MNSKHVFEPHLVLKQLTFPPAGEWTPGSPGWVFAQMTVGQAYSIHRLKSQQLETGSVIAFSPTDRGYIRASQLDEASLNFFHIQPERLACLLSLGEQHSLREAAKRGYAPQVFSADHPVSQRFKRLSAYQRSNEFSLRLQLLEIFTEVIEANLKTAGDQSGQNMADKKDARGRMAALLKQLPAAELLELNLSRLVKEIGCSPRHVSRIFTEVVGVSFREKQSEIRLMHAQELLATTETKVLQVAMESGFQSVSLFNLMFKKRFGITPAKWRDAVNEGNGRKRGSNQPLRRNLRLLWNRLCPNSQLRERANL